MKPIIPIPTHRVPKLVAETSEMITLLSSAILQLNTTDTQYSIASPHFQQTAMELNIRIEILEELVHLLPLVSAAEQHTQDHTDLQT